MELVIIVLVHIILHAEEKNHVPFFTPSESTLNITTGATEPSGTQKDARGLRPGPRLLRNSSRIMGWPVPAE